MAADKPSTWPTARSEFALRLHALAGECDRVEMFLAAALPLCLELATWRSIALVRSEGGSWQTLAAAGATARIPDDLLAEAFDQDTAGQFRGWIAVPLNRAPDQPADRLLVELSDSRGALQMAAEVVELLG